MRKEMNGKKTKNDLKLYLFGKCTVMKACFPFNRPRSLKFNMISLMSPPSQSKIKTEKEYKNIRVSQCTVNSVLARQYLYTYVRIYVVCMYVCMCAYVCMNVCMYV